MRPAMNAAKLVVIAGAVAVWCATGLRAQQPQQPPSQKDPFTFHTGVELVNVTATVTDNSGRFVGGLTQDDFRVFDDGRQQPISHFSAERVPVSIGIVIDTSGSMAGEKIEAARDALDRFLTQLLDPEDEVFLYRFDNRPSLVEGWTRDKQRISDAVRRIQPHGGTALYDAVAEAVQMAQQGRNQKKAVLIISDGNDTSSQTDEAAVRQIIRQSEVLVYAIGIDSGASGPMRIGYQQAQYPPQRPPRYPFPFPFPRPGRPPGRPYPPTPGNRGHMEDERVNASALRSITDASGGRTEIVRFPRDLDPATAGIADELSRQYYMGYAAPNGHDGRWHDIRVEATNPSYVVRARQGYVARTESR